MGEDNEGILALKAILKHYIQYDMVATGCLLAIVEVV